MRAGQIKPTNSLIFGLATPLMNKIGETQLYVSSTTVYCIGRLGEARGDALLCLFQRAQTGNKKPFEDEASQTSTTPS